MMQSAGNTRKSKAGGRNTEKSANLTCGNSVKTAAGGAAKMEKIGANSTNLRLNAVVQSQPTEREHEDSEDRKI